MVIKNITSNYKKAVEAYLEPSTLIERLRRIRALNAQPPDLGIARYTLKSFAIRRNTSSIK